jgi:hypothetical protein
MKVRILGCLAGAVALAAVASGCDGDSKEIVITQSPTVAATATAARTATAGATSTARATSTVAPTASSGRAATVTPATASATPTSPAAPAGYSTSCAAGYPWGVTVSGPFVCIDSPASGAQLASSVLLKGYAGGSFENNLVVEIQDGNGVPLGQTSLTYTSPDVGMPGSWQLTLPVPPGQPTGAPGRIVARFNSPRDGAVVASDSIDISFP